MSWIYTVFLLSCFLSCIDACITDGGFDCAKLWYFWFAIFWSCITILVIVIVVTNLCTKKGRRVSHSKKGASNYKSKQQPQQPKACRKRRNSINAQGIINVKENHGVDAKSTSAHMAFSTKDKEVTNIQMTPRGQHTIVDLESMECNNAPTNTTVPEKSLRSPASITRMKVDDSDSGLSTSTISDVSDNKVKDGPRQETRDADNDFDSMSKMTNIPLKEKDVNDF